jgi:hypothetical protein
MYHHTSTIPFLKLGTCVCSRLRRGNDDCHNNENNIRPSSYPQYTGSNQTPRSMRSLPSRTRTICKPHGQPAHLVFLKHFAFVTSLRVRARTTLSTHTTHRLTLSLPHRSQSTRYHTYKPYSTHLGQQSEEHSQRHSLAGQLHHHKRCLPRRGPLGWRRMLMVNAI